MGYKIALTSLGCAKNLINSEQMLCLLQQAGMELTVETDENVDAAIINTCGFIESAKSEAIENILYMGQLKKEGKLKKLIVAGCLPQRYQEELLKEMPEIDAIVGVGSYGSIVDVVNRLMADENRISVFGDIDAPVDETGRIVSTGGSCAYIKIAEGCDNHCAYCVIPSIRGKFRSRPMDNIVREAAILAASGIKELIVVAQDITRYGTDLYGKRCLPELIEKLSAIKGIEWIRLHYLYPDEIDDELIETVASDPKVLKYLDIPIQHINDGILMRMNRRGTGSEIRTLFKKLRERIPGLVLRTSLIAGLPGEGEAEFEELCAFLREAKIERAGVFPYSPEEGTAAAGMDRPDEETAKRRAEQIEQLQSEIMYDFNRSRIGRKTKVLCEGYDAVTKCYYGRSYAESPDIDGQIYFSAGKAKPGDIVAVRLTEDFDGDMIGEKI